MSDARDNSIIELAQASNSLLGQVYRKHASAINFDPYQSASKPLGFLARVALIAASWIGLLAVGSFVVWSFPVSAVIAGTVIAFSGVVGTVFAVNVTRHQYAKSILWRVLNDERPPVLYLRSFAADGRQLHGDPHIRRAARLTDATWSIEEVLSRHIVNLGSMVAIGRPSEPSAELGAGRVYVTHEAWQDVVADLMAGASAIVLRPGNSTGLKWEVEAVSRLGHAGKTFFLTVDENGSPLNKEAYLKLAEWVNPLIEKPLSAHGWNSWFVALSDGWEKSTLDAVGPMADVGGFQLACGEFERLMMQSRARIRS